MGRYLESVDETLDKYRWNLDHIYELNDGDEAIIYEEILGYMMRLGAAISLRDEKERAIGIAFLAVTTRLWAERVDREIQDRLDRQAPARDVVDGN